MISAKCGGCAIPLNEVKPLLKTTIWDFNGTIIDDAPGVLELNNRVYPKYGAKPFADIEAYRRVFRFPIREYYRDVGIGDDVFDAAAHDWSKGYKELAPTFPLRDGIVEAVEAFRAAGLDQVVVSASELKFLLEQLTFYPQLEGAFSAVLGLDNIYARSKTHLAKAYMREHRLTPDEVVLIGDTLHDAEVAGEIGCPCLLVEGGHQTRETLETLGVPVFQSLHEVAEYILHHLK